MSGKAQNMSEGCTATIAESALVLCLNRPHVKGLFGLFRFRPEQQCVALPHVILLVAENVVCIWTLQCDKSSRNRGNGGQKLFHVMDNMGNAEVFQFPCLGKRLMSNAGETDHLAACGKRRSGPGYAVFHHQAVTWCEAGAAGGKLVNIGGRLGVFDIFISG